MGFRQNLAAVREILETIAAGQPLCFDEPRPTFTVRGFTDTGIELQLSVWVQRDNVVEVSNSVQQSIQEAFAREAVELPAVPRMAARTAS